MYAAIRRYRIAPDRATEAIQHIMEDFVPVIRHSKGLLGYYVLDAGDGIIASINIFETQEQAEKSNTVAAEWMKQSLVAGIVSRPRVDNLFVEVDETLQGTLYEGASEPSYKQSLQLLSVPEVSELLGMGRSWVYQQIRDGQMPSVHLGGSVKVKREDLEAYIQKHRRFSARKGEE